MTATRSRPIRRTTVFGRFALGMLTALAMVAVAAPTAASAEELTYSNFVEVNIPDAVGGDCVSNTSPGTAISTMVVSDGGQVGDIRVGLDISHSWRTDLMVDLISPSGTVVRLLDRVNQAAAPNCGPQSADIIATLSDGAPASIADYGTPGAAYLPSQALSTFAGENVHGTWTLMMYDASIGDTGNLNSWSLGITSTTDLAVADTTATEGSGAAVFTVTRTGPNSNAESVDYATADGTAVAGLNYTATSGTLDFAPFQDTATVSVPLIDDTLFGGDRTFTLGLSNPQGTPAPFISVATATATIIENETPLISLLLTHLQWK